ncbi:MAG: hypothetical protein LBM05_01745 [Endomicrobium sp.]|jgi:hypothetical protein|nr:hypothetical protein [Endomicrobium sp.]
MTEPVFLLLAILAIILFAYGVFMICKGVLNYRYIKRAKRNPHLVKRSFGMVYNKKTGKIEADNKIIAPY